MSETRPHVTLVLGAGGPVGWAYHVGVLRALADEWGWDARSADVIIGTSAGAHVGALLRAGWDWRRMMGHAKRPAPASAAAATMLAPSAATARRWPTSKAYLRAVLGRRSRLRIGPLVAALLPEGARSGSHHGAGYDRMFEKRWPHRPLWIPAVHVDSGARVVFGRQEAPRVDVATAVRCSSAVPGLHPPVAVAGERYVDGGIASCTHADLAVARLEQPPRRRVVAVLSPLSKFALLRVLLRLELRPLSRLGIDVVLFEPDREVSSVMGWNPMSSRAVVDIAEAAYRSTAARLHHAAAADLVQLLVGRR